MIVGRNTEALSEFNITSSLLEPVINTEASDYMQDPEHYGALVKYAKSLGIKEEKAGDLVHDVLVSILEAERDGQGFDMEYGVKNGNNNIMVVEQFIKGRMTKYSKNVKYRTDIVEAGNVTVSRTVCIETPVVDKHGYVYDSRGNIVTERKYEKQKFSTRATVNAASYNQGADGVDNNDSFQKAYSMAVSNDSVDECDEFYSLREQIDYCIDICDNNGVNIINIFKNMDVLANMLGDFSRKKKSADNIFAKISELAEYHSEFRDALISVLTYSSSHRSNFETVLAGY